MHNIVIKNAISVCFSEDAPFASGVQLLILIRFLITNTFRRLFCKHYVRPKGMNIELLEMSKKYIQHYVYLDKNMIRKMNNTIGLKISFDAA